MTPDSAELTDAEFLRILAGAARDRLRVEAQPFYDIDDEAADLDDWADAMRDGRQPRTPPEIDWWADYLDRIRAQARRGVTIGRIRVIDDPPTSYQRWLMWAAPWYARAGEQVWNLPRAQAAALGLEDDWVLADDALILLRHYEDGLPAGQALITDPDTVAAYAAKWDLAIAHATAATPAAA